MSKGKRNNEEVAIDNEGTIEGAVEATVDASAVEAKKANAKAKRLAKIAFLKEARAKAQAFIASPDSSILPDEVKAAIGTLIAGAKVKRTTATRSVVSVNSAIKDALLKAGDAGLSEIDVFKMFKIGRPEMSIKRRLLVMTKKPEDRVWFVFDADKEIYRVIATGEKTPEGWDGYIPTSAEQL